MTIGLLLLEAIQTILRREGFPKPYEALKGLTRTNQEITKESIQEFILTLDISEEVKAELFTDQSAKTTRESRS